MHSVVRAFAAAGLAAFSLGCADDGVGTRRGAGLASLPIAPVFATTPSGGPKIEIEVIRGVLRRVNSSDSSVASALVEGDSAILEFHDVEVTGDSTKYNLGVRAFDANNVVVFEGVQEVSIKPGDNTPAQPTLAYTAPDATVATIDIQQGTTSVGTVELQWAGAQPGNTQCLNRAPDASAQTTAQLSIVGLTAAAQPVPGVRVGWTSRDTTVVTVDEDGLVRARCSNRFTYVVARTFLDFVDSVKINVTAPPFTLLMDPETSDVGRGSTLQMTAVVVDENGNSLAASADSWNSSDPERATVSATGLVTGISNGRVVITASASGRSTVGIIQVVRPAADSVAASPGTASINVNQRLVLGAVAFDANDQRILDASGFTWTSTNASVASVTSSGSVLGVSAGLASIIVSLDGKADTVPVTVTNATTGSVAGRVVDGSTHAALSAATITSTANPTGADGRFTTNQLNPSPVPSIQVTRTGYVSFQYFNLPVQVGTTIELGDLPMAPTGGTGTLTGTVVNAVNDAGVSGATVRLFTDITPDASLPNCTVSCTPLLQTTTSAAGVFTFANVPAGTYTYTVTASGFSFTRRVTVSLSGQTRDTRINLAPALTGNALRIVLSWGDCSNPSVPCDLDAHLTGPASAPDTGRFHVAFYQLAYVSGTDSVGVLDEDEQVGLGPETVTLRQKAAGVYKYYVHNFTDRIDTASTRLSTSAQARVDVYQGANLVATFLPPSGQQGTIWAVLQVEGSTITPMHQMLKIQDFSHLPSDFMVVRDAEAERLVRELQSRRKRK